MKAQDFWNKYDFTVGQTKLFRAGYAEVLVKHIANGWLIKNVVLTEPAEELSVTEVQDFADDQEIFHFQTGQSHQLHVVPAFPNKAVVFRNNKNIRISAGQTTDLFLRVPLNIQLYFQEIKDENQLLDLPLQRLSDTWFGDTDNGEPAFSIGSNYDKTFDAVHPNSWEAIVPAEIINNTLGVLDLQRLILRVEDFSIFLRNQQLLSNHVAIEFKGIETAGSVNLTTRRDLHGQKPLQIGRPRSSETRNLLRKSFFFIKNIYQS